MDSRINSWEDYWTYYSLLIDNIKVSNQNEIADNLKIAQTYTTGLTDGWYDYLETFKDIIKNNKNSLSAEQVEISAILLKYLKTALDNH